MNHLFDALKRWIKPKAATLESMTIGALPVVEVDLEWVMAIRDGYAAKRRVQIPIDVLARLEQRGILVVTTQWTPVGAEILRRLP